MRIASRLVAGLALCAATSGAVRAAETRFRLHAEAHLERNTSIHAGARFELSGQLGLPQPAPASAWALQTRARFMLTATASASLVCYNDTIFRDGFDGTGL